MHIRSKAQARTARFGGALKLAFSLAAGLVLGLAAGAPALAQEVNLYTYREPGLIKPLLAQFTKETGIRVNTLFAGQGLEQRIGTEGARSPADLLLTVDIGRIQEAIDLGIAQPLRTDALAAAIPAVYRDPDGLWNGLSARARVVYAAKERVPDTALTYESLADPKWKGRICIRSGQHNYNLALIANFIARHGEEKAEAWLRGLKANLARRPAGGDREVARDIAGGICDIGLGNTYYIGLLANGDDEKKGWAAATRVVLPTFEGGGTHVNVSAVILARHAPNRDNAVRLVEWLTGEEAQNLYARTNFEYPVRAGVPLDPVIAAFGDLKPDTTPLAEIARYRKAASLLVDKVRFDD